MVGLLPHPLFPLKLASFEENLIGFPQRQAIVEFDRWMALDGKYA